MFFCVSYIIFIFMGKMFHFPCGIFWNKAVDGKSKEGKKKKIF